MAKVTRCFSFDDQRDAALLQWLASQENASQAVRDALQASMSGEVTLEQVLDAVRDLGARMGSSSSVPPIPGGNGREDAVGTEQAAESLSLLGL